MSRAVLSLGSNLGDRLGTLRSAAEAFGEWQCGASPVYETPPWGPVEQGPYLNAIIVVDDPSATAWDWLNRAQAAEQAAGRVRDVRWGPRTLDVDVIDVDEMVQDDPALTLPHPRAHERAFVLVPWQALDPVAQLAGRPVAQWLGELPDAELDGVRLFADRLVEGDPR
jgi:2-amino-4-hydroxy-6-hydroxymethyldihydropteridine diphosphokinase